MNSKKTALARLVLTLFAGMMFWSSWSLQAARHGMPPAGALAPRQKLEMSRRLSQAASDPAKIKPADLEAVKVTFGAETSSMLALLRDASR